jgi:dienelactone hydrolase
MRKNIFILVILVLLLVGCKADSNNTKNGSNDKSDNESNNSSSQITELPIEFGSDDFKLPGILTAPKAAESYPVVILVHGSGPSDKDATIGLNKPFKDIADNLAKQGIGVVRYDKRAMKYPKKLTSIKDFTVYDETIDDVVYAYNYISNNDEVKASDIYILGHSMGGYLIPRIAQELLDASGYIVLAGNARPLEDLIAQQIPYLINLDGTVTKEEQQQLDYYNDVVNNIKSINLLSNYTLQDLGGASKSYWLDLKDYNPIALAKNITKPMLFLQGTRDYQVTIEDFNLWKSELESNSNITFKLYDNLNHLFMKGEGASSPQEYYTASHVEQVVIDDISKWIKNNK